MRCACPRVSLIGALTALAACTAPQPMGGAAEAPIACAISMDCPSPLVCVAGVCGPAGLLDAGRPDAVPDLDASVPDALASPRDADAMDAGEAPPHDAGRADALPDAGDPDARPLDAAVLDAGIADGGEPEAGPPPIVNLSGWVLQNREHDPVIQRAIIPGGTQLRGGDILLLVRGADRAAFEGFLGRGLPAHVTVIDTQAGNRGAPILNGGERWALTDQGGALIDGPTVPSTVGDAFARLDGDAAAPGSWQVQPARAATPGVSDLRGVPRGIYITEWSDPQGAGQYVFEYVELTYVP